MKEIILVIIAVVLLLFAGLMKTSNGARSTTRCVSLNRLARRIGVGKREARVSLVQIRQTGETITECLVIGYVVVSGNGRIRRLAAKFRADRQYRRPPAARLARAISSLELSDEFQEPLVLRVTL
jgi:hypothetical protein